jgi:hypothetical protein
LCELEKMTFENIIVCVISLIAIAIVGYYMYTKVNAQNQEMLKLAKRCETIEMMFARPPPPDDLQAMYKPKYAHEGRPRASDDERLHEEKRPQAPPPCESAMCDLEPLHIETNENELDYIVKAELRNVIETENTSPKRKMKRMIETPKKD